jgi:DedD protein
VAETTKRFLVQIGVFSNHTNAEELVNRLHQAGIPAQIESRVQVGPFVSRLEVDAARAKLKTMGLDEGLLVRR